ncbi:MAG: ElaA protein [Glaciecola sp.]
MNTIQGAIEPSFSNYKFAELSNLSLYSALKLRSDVFVVEQNCIYSDLDDKDIHSNTLHLLVETTSDHLLNDQTESENKVIAYARCLAPGISYKGPSIGRVAVALSERGHGLAKLVMLEAINICKQHWPDETIQIGAQVYLQAFYTQLGFTSFSEPYDEDGIMHIDMQLQTKP